MQISRIDKKITTDDIIHKTGAKTGKILADIIYPVGSIYLSVNDTNPTNLFGGTWERVSQGMALVGVDENDTDFNTSEKIGGEKKHTLTIDKMPSHSHAMNWNSGPNPNMSSIQWTKSTNGTQYLNTNGTGGSRPHNNLQPYYTVYIWKRTS